MQAEDGGLQQDEASSEEEAKAQGQIVALASFRFMEGVEGSDDAA